MIKVKHEGEIHIVKASLKDEGIKLLKRSVVACFKSIPEHFVFIYIDEDGDQITIETESDFKNLLLLSQEQKSKGMIKLLIRQSTDDLLQQQFASLTENASEGIEILDQLQESEHLNMEESELNESMASISDLDSIEIVQIVKSNLKIIESQLIQQAYKYIPQSSDGSEADQNDDQVSEFKGDSEDELTDNIKRNAMQSSEIDYYLHRLYEDQSQLQTLSGQASPFYQFSEVSSMIQASLSKLLPSFVQTVSKQTLQNIEQYCIQNQKKKELKRR